MGKRKEIIMKIVLITFFILLSWSAIDTTFLIAEDAGILKTYEEKLAKIKDSDSNAYYQLGLWCKDNNLTEPMNEMFIKVIQLNPEHKEARKQIGYVKFEDKWIKEEELPYYRSEQAKVNNLIMIIKNPCQKPERKEDALHELDKIEGKHQVKPLTEILSQTPSCILKAPPDDKLKTYAIKKLGESGDERAAESLAKTVLYDAKPDFREKALTSLVTLKPIGQDKSEKLLVNALDDDSRLIRCRAAYGLQMAGSREVIGRLIRRLHIVYGPSSRSYICSGNMFGYVGSDGISMVTPGQCAFSPKPAILFSGVALDVQIIRIDREITIEYEIAVIRGALNSLSGQDFGVDYNKWVAWWNEQNKPK